MGEGGYVYYLLSNCVKHTDTHPTNQPLTRPPHLHPLDRPQVTALGWNPRYPDLFAAGYGSYAFENQASRCV